MATITATSFAEAKQQGIGATWRKPAFWPPYDEIATVVYVSKHYILSSYHDSVYLSMGDADWQYICANDPDCIRRFVQRFEAPATPQNDCHYCGMTATDIGFFGEPICRECGGRS